jgi:hypothetical protein
LERQNGEESVVHLEQGSQTQITASGLFWASSQYELAKSDSRKTATNKIARERTSMSVMTSAISIAIAAMESECRYQYQLETLAVLINSRKKRVRAVSSRSPTMRAIPRSATHRRSQLR